MSSKTPDTRKVLILEDPSSEDAELRERFTRTGFQLAICSEEAAGLERLEQWRPDVVIISLSHPAGNFVEYCRQARAIVPGARLVVTTPHGKARLLDDHPGLRTVVDGVIVRPDGAMRAGAGAAPGPNAAPVAGANSPPAHPDGEMGAEFQRQVEAKYLEVEELKRSSREAEKKWAVALATEQLKCAELETKLDNLLRMKEDFEFRAQNEIDERTQEADDLRQRLQDLEAGGGRVQAEQAALRAQLESVLVEKERLEERCHALVAAAQQKTAAAGLSEADALRLATLEKEQDRVLAEADQVREALRAAQASRADLENKLAAALEAQAAEAGREEQRRGQDAAQTQALRQAQRHGEQLQASIAKLEERLVASEAARVSVAAEAEAAVFAANEKAGSLETELIAGRDQLARAERRCVELGTRAESLEAELAAGRDLLAGAERRCAELETRLEELENRASREADRIRSLIEERDGLQGRLLERESLLGAEVREWRQKAESAVQELGLLRADALRTAGGDQDQLRRLDEQLREALEAAQEAREQSERGASLLSAQRETAQAREREAALSLDALRARIARLEEQVLEAERSAREAQARVELAESAVTTEREIAAKRDRETARLLEAERTRSAQLEERLRETERIAADAKGRVEIAQVALATEREASRDREREAARLLEAERVRIEQLELQQAPPAAEVPQAASPELQRIQELLEEVVTRARTEAVDHARRESELATRLQGVLEERRLLQERFDRAGVEATERERRSAVLLQSAIDRGPAPWTERANLPAVVPLEPLPGSGGRSRRIPLFAGAALLALALTVLLGTVLLRRATTTAPVNAPAGPSETQRPQKPGGPAAGQGGPREVWDRWTRTDVSGQVLVQATLRNEHELRGVVEAEQRSRGWSDEESRAQLAQKLEVFQFDGTWYVTVYLKNLTPGYPAYLDDLAGRFRLRDRAGREAPAFVPPGLERDLRVFTYGVGASGEPIYEATITLGFSRAGLSNPPGYLQLVVSDVGTASRRVLTWELE